MARSGAQGEIDRFLDEIAGVPGLAVKPGQPMARLTTLRIGGPAELLVEVASERALVRLLTLVHDLDLPFQLLGLGSNVLVPDAGLPGVVAKLGGELKRVRIRGLRVSAGAGAPLAIAARKAAKAGLAGLEALAGFPSTVGGAVFMNAGCYGTEIKDVLRSARLVEADGRRHRIGVGDLGASYRATRLKATGAIVTRALFDLTPGDPEALLARMEELNAKRWASLPSGQANAGSIFKNPPGEHAGRLLDVAGMKGMTVGGAQVSPKHANVIVNTGGATAADVIALMRRMRVAVAEKFAVRLEPEIVLLGDLGARFFA
ncbi:MAG: UDP-N-acetylmuramate dehydrogenase [Thermoanaerobaculia bacterium]